MAESTSGTLFFTNDGNTLLLSENDKVSCWDFQKGALQFSIDGEPVGLSNDSKILCLKFGHAFQCYELPTGKKIDHESIKREEFAWYQRAVIMGKPNAAELIVEDIFDRHLTRRLSLDGKMTFDNPARVYNTQYVVVRTWWDTSYIEGETLGCYNVETGEQVIKASSNGNCKFGITWSKEQDAIAIEECGRIRAYSLQSRQQLYEIMRPTNMNLGYKLRHTDGCEHKEYFDDYDNVVRNPQSVANISLHPKFSHMLAIATGEEILLVDMSRDIRSTFKNWSSGQVIQSFQGRSTFRGITFSPDGNEIVYISSNYKLNVQEVASDKRAS